MKVIKGGITAARGYLASGLNCGIKKSGKYDLALIYSTHPAVAAGVFTKNSIKAAPLLVTEKHLRKNLAQAIIINSGNANCFTGHFGMMYAQKTCHAVAKKLKIPAENVLVASTGIIGKPLPYKKIESKLQKLIDELSIKGGFDAAKGILTTDKKTKEIAVHLTLGHKKVTIGACAKGSGMIEPNMATMLAFIATDACISAKLLKAALKEAVNKTFNMITVDGCMSTNDMVTILANGIAGNKIISSKGQYYKKFVTALECICLDLAKKIVKDGEGAHKFIEINVCGAPSENIAQKAAKCIANSNLVKTAAFGNNPNWGRVAAAVGSLALKKINEKSLKIKFSSFDKKNILIGVDLNNGPAQATVYTSDLSNEYVRINSEYN